MRVRDIGVIGLAFSSISLAQTIVGLSGSDPGSRINQQTLAQRQGGIRKASNKDVVVFTGDRVIPQFVDGGSWKTSLFFVNLENHQVNFQVLFFNDDGTDMVIPILGQGLVRAVDITLNTAGSVEIETAGSAPNLAQGWALLSQTSSDSVGGMAIFRQSVAGRADQEAVVPIVSQFDNHFVLLFDNTAFTTAIALANPTTSRVEIPVNIRNQAGQIIDQRTVVLGSYNHTAFTLPDTWSST